ncbi:cation-transporting P-type ATPase [Sphingobacterium chungjuense]|uniref:cation-transporting P-type ATPase n=1 Tax=Sphingobacterium chungjuense TaxID=2675553 RepID=UPI00140962EB|nr:cation-transporting P-type ATPase [Sphingobacterium chungjuense]
MANANQEGKSKAAHWHALDVDTVLSRLEVDTSEGLNKATAEKLLKKHGRNELPQKKKESTFIRFIKHFHDVLIYVLLAAAVVTTILGHYTDTIVIILVAIINAAIGFVQEGKAEKALESIKGILSLKATVLRDGKREEIDATEVVLGDIVLLSAGDKVPADLRLFESDNLKIEESALTGESESSEKNTEPLEEDMDLGDRKNMAYTSTTVSNGTGKGVVIAIGKDTEIGKINQMMSDVTQLTTPLLRQTAQFGKTVALATLVLAAATFAYGYFLRDYDTEELLMSVIGLAVAAIPEGLPAILSIILAIGVQNLAKRNAIIRNLPSVETLGSVSVICSDKTGTLTRNEMTVKDIVLAEQQYAVTGIGYSPEEGEIQQEKKAVKVEEDDNLQELLRCVYICNEASLDKGKDGDWGIKGDPTEGALVTVYEKSGLEKEKPKRESTIPFDSDYKYMATLIEQDGQGLMYVKGAPDRLIELATKQLGKDGEEVDIDADYWEEQVSALAKEGKRLIAAAYKKVSSSGEKIDHDDLQEDLVMIGLAGIIDPPREEAIEAIKICTDAGIRVKMITGDHVDTAKAIGQEMGIGDGEKACRGADLEKMSDEEMRKAVKEYDIFARTSPEHKLRLVEALQAEGRICAMTGDGVNDAPALKKADVGIAMGIKGTEVTKDASEMVLADDNFRTIVDAVEEGRRIYDNLKKTILFILPTNGAESLLIMASILFGYIMPLTPLQILWVNMVTSVTVSLALAFEEIEDGTMKRPPRREKEPLLSGYFIWRIIFVSVLIGGGTLYLVQYLTAQGVENGTIRTVTMQTIVISQLFHLFNCRSIHGTAFDSKFFSNKAIYIVAIILFVLQAAITYLPFMNNIFDTEPIALSFWQYPVYLGVAVFVIVEMEKWIVRKFVLTKKEEQTA